MDKVLEANGAIFKYGERNKPYMEVDGRLVTGQNWKSSAMVTQKTIELLKLNE